jgi:hypothetical protein
MINCTIQTPKGSVTVLVMDNGAGDVDISLAYRFRDNDLHAPFADSANTVRGAIDELERILEGELTFIKQLENGLETMISAHFVATR